MNNSIEISLQHEYEYSIILYLTFFENNQRQNNKFVNV